MYFEIASVEDISIKHTKDGSTIRIECALSHCSEGRIQGLEEKYRLLHATYAHDNLESLSVLLAEFLCLPPQSHTKP